MEKRYFSADYVSRSRIYKTEESGNSSRSQVYSSKFLIVSMPSQMSWPFRISFLILLLEAPWGRIISIEAQK